MTIEREQGVEKIGTEPCPCGHRSCRKTFLTGIGSFVQGSGFDPDEAHRIVTAVNSHAALLEAVKNAREALHQHYVDWDGEPEDAVPLQLARTKCDAAIALASSDGKGE